MPQKITDATWDMQRWNGISMLLGVTGKLPEFKP